MCGLVGYYSAKTQADQDIINSMLDTIRHRGPDDYGVFEMDQIKFGHVRLSIIDIAHGHQPMSDHTQRYTIIYNGEIYNYLELRQDLIIKNYPLSTYSDTEVLLYAYIEYGVEVLQRLNGMFAFAIYDKIEKTIFCARDHFGIKPFYYWNKQSDFVFASEVKALLRYPGIQSQVNRDVLYDYLTFQIQMDENTLFKDIYSLEPAHYMIIRNGIIEQNVRYWEINYTIDETMSLDQFADNLLILLENSLSIQVRSDVPVGAHLSGGLDSSTVAVLASKNYYGKFQTFTGGFRDSEIYDETKYARIVSESIDSELHYIYPEVNDFIDLFEKLVYHMDYPGGGPGIFPQYMVSKLASDHVKVVLGGQGGDEIFGGYSRYAVAYLEQCLKGAIFETQDEGKHVVTLASIIENLPSLKQYIPMIKSQFASGLFDSMDQRYYHLIDRSPNLNRIYDAEFIDQRNPDLIFTKFRDIFQKPDTPSYFNKMTYFDIKTLLPTLLQIEDRMSMAVSLESRVPLLDYRIVELAATMPPTMKFAGGKTKYMLNHAVKNVLPKAIVQRKDKMGFPVPINEWMKGPLKEYVLDIFNSQVTKERSMYKVDNIIDVIENQEKFNRDIWGALNIEIWFRQFIDG